MNPYLIRAHRLTEYCTQRMLVYEKRTFGQKPPWTPDPILHRGHFTNVYRELDPGTQYCWRNILDRLPQTVSLPEVALNVMLYRLIGLESSWDMIRWVEPDPGSIWAAFERLLAHRTAGNTIFTGAYMVNSYTKMGTSDKVLNVMRLMLQLVERDNWRAFELGFTLRSDRRDIIDHISALYGWGPFLAYQVVVDLSYPRDGMLRRGELDHDGSTSWLGPVRGSNNGHVEFGPGAWRGLQRLIPEITYKNAPDAMRALANTVNGELSKVSLLLKDENGHEIPLTAANLANNLCELDKYERASEAGEKPRVRQFDAVAAYRRDREQRGHGQQLAMEGA